MTQRKGEWRALAVSQLGKVVTGKTPTSQRPELFGSEYPFITPTDMDFDKVRVATERFLSTDGRNNQKSLLLPKHSVCFCCIGATIGKICMTDRESFTNQQINSVIVDTNEHEPYFVYSLLRTLKDDIVGIAGGAATPIVNKSAFSNFRVVVPSLHIQCKIAGILSAYDDLIENNTRRIAILEEMAQAIYREWFVDFRFPGHEKVKLIDSTRGKIPNGWEVKSLSDLCLLTMGQSPSSEFYNETGEGLPFHQGVTNFGDRYPTHITYTTVTSRLAEKDDVLFSVRAPVGRLNIADTRLVMGRGVSAIRHRGHKQVFLFHQLRQRFEEEDTMGGGTIFKSVTKEDMQKIALISPPLALVDHFETAVGGHFQLYHNLTSRNRLLRQTRDLLLPKLISGQLDVEELDIETGEPVAEAAKA
jgi:type I restriction enzyme S subunit